jgi:hypothetical protein
MDLEDMVGDRGFMVVFLYYPESTEKSENVLTNMISSVINV